MEKWKYSLTITKSGDEVTTGDCYLQAIEFKDRILKKEKDEDWRLSLSVCNHGDGGRNHLHGMYSGSLNARELQGLVRGGFSTVRKFHPLWNSYVSDQRLGDDFTITRGVLL